MSSARVAAFTVSVVSFLFLAACADQSSPTSATHSIPAAVAIAGVHTLTTKGETLQLHALVTFADGSVVDETADGRWSSASPDVVSIGRDGLATAIRDGRTTIAVTIGGVSDARMLIVDLPTGG